MIKFSNLFRSVRNLKQHRLVTNIGAYVFGSALRQGIAFLLIPLYTRFLTPEDYGITGLTLAVGSVLLTLFGLGIPGSIARYYYKLRDDPESLSSFISTNFLYLLGFAGSATLALFLLGDALWTRLISDDIPFTPYMRLVLWSTFFAVLIQVSMSLYRTQQNARAFTTAQVSGFLLEVSASILFIVSWHWGAAGQLAGRLFGNAVLGSVLSLLLVKRWFSPRLRWDHLKTSLLFGLPLVPHQLSGWALTSIDRLLLESRISLAELGRYSLGYQVGLVMSILVVSIHRAWSPYYYGLMKDNKSPEKRIVQVADLYVAGVGGLCLVGGLFAFEILYLLTPQQYHEAAIYVPLILFAYLLYGYYYFAVMPAFYYEKTKWIPMLTIASALLNIILNLWWIPYWGAMGSTWATVVAYACTLVAVYFLGRRWQKVAYPLIKYGAANALIFVGILLATYNMPSGIQLETLAWKFGLLSLFAVIAYLLLVKPNLSFLGLGRAHG